MVELIAFPQQKWLRERASMLRYISFIVLIMSPFTCLRITHNLILGVLPVTCQQICVYVLPYVCNSVVGALRCGELRAAESFLLNVILFGSERSCRRVLIIQGEGLIAHKEQIEQRENLYGDPRTFQG